MIKCSDCGCEGIHACLGKPVKKEDLPKCVFLLGSGELTKKTKHKDNDLPWEEQTSQMGY